MPTLLTLPEEVKAMIAQRVQRLDDLKSLSLTCWGLYDAAMLDMYRKVTFREEAGLPALILALSSRNKAVQYIRHFELVPAGKKGPSQLNEMVLLIADRLNNNTLLTFTSDGASLWGATLHAIHRHQSRLLTARHSISQLPTEKMQCIKSFQICRVPASLQSVWTALSKLPLLDTLELVAPLCDSRAADSEPQRSNLRMQELFLWGDGELKLQQLHLRSLVCHGMDLSLAGAVLRRAVHIGKLEALTLQKCYAPLALLTHAILDSDDDNIQLRHLVITARDKASSGIFNEDISEIVYVIGELETLVLHVPDLPAFEFRSPVLHEHAPFLRTLYFNRTVDFKWDTTGMDNETRHTLFAWADKLEQLTVCANQFRVAEMDPYHDPSLRDLCDDLADSQSLKVVHLLVDPMFHVPYSGEWARRIAEKVFDSVPTLKIVCVGNFSKGAADDCRLLFARGETILVGTEEKNPGVLRVNSSQAREIEPLADLCEMDPLGQRILRFGFTRRG